MKIFFLDKTPPKPKKSTNRTKTHKKKCKFCGDVFETDQPNQIYCTAECRSDYELEHNKEKAPPIVREKKKKRTIDDYIAESEACGLSYGQYKAQRRLGKTFEELKAAYEEKKDGVW